jgi:hypothetical protein
MSNPMIQVGENALFIGESLALATAKITFIEESIGIITVDHTLVDESMRGQGIALKLVKAVVDYARERQLKIIPLCPYAKKVLEGDETSSDVVLLM